MAGDEKTERIFLGEGGPWERAVLGRGRSLEEGGPCGPGGGAGPGIIVIIAENNTSFSVKFSARVFLINVK